MSLEEIIKLEPRLLNIFKFATENKSVENNLDVIYNKCMHRNNLCISDLVGYKSKKPILTSSDIYETVVKHLSNLIWEK